MPSGIDIAVDASPRLCCLSAQFLILCPFEIESFVPCMARLGLREFTQLPRLQRLRRSFSE